MMSLLPRLPLYSGIDARRDTVNELKEQTWGQGRGLFLLPSTLGPGAGMGVFTAAPIPKDSLITHYEGVLIPQAQIDMIFPSAAAKSHARTLFSLRWVILANWRMAPDSARGIEPIAAPVYELPYRYGLAGYLNDIRDPARYNVEFLRLADSKADAETGQGAAVFLRALRDIPAGAELFVNYGEDYWKR